jgi:uncharacterized membrane protein YdjX (TVP38/TMEM64 family)
MASLRRVTLVFTAVLTVPVLPLIVLGLAFEDRVEAWLMAAQVTPAARAGLVIGLLAIDIFLPIPASAISTWAGGVLGVVAGAAASTMGMTLGAVVGFAVARAWGAPIARRLAGGHDLEQTASLARRIGPLALIVTRALPILAEACVLLMGMSRLSWRRFLPPTILANLLISIIYAACGQYFQSVNALPIAIVASGTVPLGVALAARWWWRRRRNEGR